MKIKILLCDDMPYVCHYFKTILGTKENIELVGIANSAESCMELVREKNPDVVLLDIQINTDDEGIHILKSIKEYSENINVIMLTIHEEDEFIFRSISLGASDYILKNDNPEVIMDAIVNAYNGKTSLNPQIAQKLINECYKVNRRHNDMHKIINSIAQLTASEYKILNLIYEGHSYSEIAKARFVEEVTIRTQVNKILKKFEARNMSELISHLKKIQIFENPHPEL